MPPSVTPTIILETEFQDIESGFKRTSAIVGEPLRWEIATIRKQRLGNWWRWVGVGARLTIL